MGSDSNVGLIWAERWGTAHEEGTDSNPPLERSMDLHNNRIGRQLAKDNADDDPSALRAAVRNGSCRIIRAGELVRSDNEGEANYAVGM